MLSLMFRPCGTRFNAWLYSSIVFLMSPSISPIFFNSSTVKAVCTSFFVLFMVKFPLVVYFYFSSAVGSSRAFCVPCVISLFRLLVRLFLIPVFVHLLGCCTLLRDRLRLNQILKLKHSCLFWCYLHAMRQLHKLLTH